MPYIDMKVTSPLDDALKVKLKDGLGRIITLIPGKTEAVTMIHLAGNADLYLDGKRLCPGAYVEVKTFGETAREHKEAVTVALFELLDTLLAIPADAVYITYYGQQEWGCNGGLLAGNQ